MKKKLIALMLLLTLLLAGCNLRAADEQLDRAEDRLDQMGDNLEGAVESALYANTGVPGTTPQPPATSAPQSSSATLTPEEAQAIALKHAGYTADQVSRLRVEVEIDDRVPQYEVSFRQSHLECDYEVHAETGEILSFERDD